MGIAEWGLQNRKIAKWEYCQMGIAKWEYCQMGMPNGKLPNGNIAKLDTISELYKLNSKTSSLEINVVYINEHYLMLIKKLKKLKKIQIL